MSIATETQVQDVLALMQTLSGPDRDRLLKLLRREPNEPLPERASLDEAIELYLADACGIGRAAELAGVTRWDVIDRLKERGLWQIVPDLETVEEMDAVAEVLRREGYL
ncbi:MAG TPA: UPF0175 family protein [Blastocatellia bacterium]|nr:UPF0175 family protein [Blastocatellia bacterium]